MKGFRIFLRGAGPEAAHRAELCRPLQPGPSVLHQPDAARQRHIADALTFELSKVETR